MTLNSVLPLESSDFSLYVMDQFSFPAASVYKLTVSISDTSHPLKVTLAWYDTASALNSVNNFLIRNLDLYVKGSSVTWYGNGKIDNLHPQEQVLITSLSKTTYDIYIVNKYGANAVKAALVITCAGKVVSDLQIASNGYTEVRQLLEELENSPNLANGYASQEENKYPSLRVESYHDSDPDPDSRILGETREENFNIMHTLEPLESVYLSTFKLAEDEAINSVSMDLDSSLPGVFSTSE